MDGLVIATLQPYQGENMFKVASLLDISFTVLYAAIAGNPSLYIFQRLEKLEGIPCD